jgi:hypothetical protein
MCLRDIFTFRKPNIHMNFSLADNEKEALLGALKIANLKFQQTYPGDKPDRQPVHTVYGGANLFKSDTCIKMGEIALKSLQTYAPNFVVLADVLQLEGFVDLPSSDKKIEKLRKRLDRMSEKKIKEDPAWLACSVSNKITKKLKTEPVEDFRIDFEDGFGNRPDDEEDATAITGANELA